MRTRAIATGVAALLLGAALGGAAQLDLRDPKQRAFDVKLEPFHHADYSGRFAAGKRALAIAVGDAAAGAGLYVFDKDGNCVASDDDLSLRSRDDLAVEWLPPQTALYSLELRSLGRAANVLLLSVRQD
jgi:hypothetical protein